MGGCWGPGRSLGSSEVLGILEGPWSPRRSLGSSKVPGLSGILVDHRWPSVSREFIRSSQFLRIFCIPRVSSGNLGVLTCPRDLCALREFLGVSF